MDVDWQIGLKIFFCSLGERRQARINFLAPGAPQKNRIFLANYFRRPKSLSSSFRSYEMPLKAHFGLTKWLYQLVLKKRKRRHCLKFYYGRRLAKKPEDFLLLAWRKSPSSNKFPGPRGASKNRIFLTNYFRRSK